MGPKKVEEISEAEKKRLEIEYAKQLKRDRLKREIAYSSLTIKRYEKKWMEMLTKIALPKVRADLEFMWHRFEKVLDCKDFTTSLLMDELRDAEEQYLKNNRSHVDHVDKLIDLFREKVEELEKDYNSQIAELKQRNNEENGKITLSTEEGHQHLKTMSYMLEAAKKQYRQLMRTDYYSKIELEEKRLDDEIHRLKGIKQKKFQDMLKGTVKFLTDYKQRTVERRKEHDRLKERDEAIQKLMVSHLEKIRKTSEYVKILKVKYNDSRTILQSKLNDLQQEDEFFDYSFNTLKTQLKTDMKKDAQQITTLTVTYNETLAHLENLRDKLKNILLMGELCRKLETEQEKIKPFPMEKEKTVVKQTTEETEDTGPEGYFPSLELFWQRVAQADASRYEILEEKEFLMIENEILKLKLYEYLQPISCPVPEKNGLGQPIKHITDGVQEQRKYEKQNMTQFPSSGKNYDVDEDVE